MALPADANGAIDVDDLDRRPGRGRPVPTIVCLQAGNVNTGACDDLTAICDLPRRGRAWVHVDGAFGLWAAASPSTRHLVAGVERADSWGCDGHKWLNVPYDAGYVFCADPEAHAASMAYGAAYLDPSGSNVLRSPGDFVPESSRRARGFATWAALRQLGRAGVADLVDRCCSLARAFAEALAPLADVTIANHVVLNQVLVDFGSASPNRSDHRRRPARRHVLDGRHHLARPALHAHLGVQCPLHPGRCRGVGRRHPPMPLKTLEPPDQQVVDVLGPLLLDPMPAPGKDVATPQPGQGLGEAIDGPLPPDGRPVALAADEQRRHRDRLAAPRLQVHPVPVDVAVAVEGAPEAGALELRRVEVEVRFSVSQAGSWSGTTNRSRSSPPLGDRGHGPPVGRPATSPEAPT